MLTAYNSNFRNMFLSDMRRHDSCPDIVLETSSKEVLRFFEANGIGVALMPEMTAETELKTGSLVRLKWVGDNLLIYSQIFVYNGKCFTKTIEGLSQLIKYAV